MTNLKFIRIEGIPNSFFAHGYIRVESIPMTLYPCRLASHIHTKSFVHFDICSIDSSTLMLSWQGVAWNKFQSMHLIFLLVLMVYWWNLIDFQSEIFSSMHYGLDHIFYYVIHSFMLCRGYNISWISSYTLQHSRI